MKIALIAPPFIPVPPPHYGGTELFLGNLALGLQARGFEPVLYTNGESTLPVEKRYLYERAQWPIDSEVHHSLADLAHTTWAMRDATDCDLLHLNNAPGLAVSGFVPRPIVCTIHHKKNPDLSRFYGLYPDVNYVTISRFQLERESMPRRRAILHGIDLDLYRVQEKKQPYLSFLGRLAPDKGAHLAIQVARKAGIPLKIAGEVQPMFREYYEREVRPHVDGKFIEFVGKADLAEKNELLGNSLAMLFPIQWDEPFGLVMIEAMACGTPVLALPGGSVPEVVHNGISGYVGNSVDELAAYARDLCITPATVRQYAEENFSLDRMAGEYISLYEEVVAGNPASGADESTEGERAIA